MTTGRARAKRRGWSLLESRETHQFLIDNTSDGVFLQDQYGLIANVNENFLTRHGYSKKEVIGKDIYEFLGLKPVHLGSKKTRSTAPNRDVHKGFKLKWQRKDGHTIPGLVSSEPIYDEKGNLKGRVSLFTEIAKRESMEEDLSRTGETFYSLSRHLQSVTEKESKRIAREIHDELGQALTALKMDLSWLARKLPQGVVYERQYLEKISSMSSLIDKTIQVVQKISAELRPGLLDDLGLGPAIEWLTQDFKTRTGIKARLDFDYDALNLNAEWSTALFRIVQEALTNIARHAKATRVNISFAEKNRRLQLKVKDNGRGIREDDIASPVSFGIIGMRERIRPYGGILKLMGIPDKGTTLSVVLPLKKRV